MLAARKRLGVVHVDLCPQAIALVLRPPITSRSRLNRTLVLTLILVTFCVLCYGRPRQAATSTSGPFYSNSEGQPESLANSPLRKPSDSKPGVLKNLQRLAREAWEEASADQTQPLPSLSVSNDPLFNGRQFTSSLLGQVKPGIAGRNKKRLSAVPSDLDADGTSQPEADTEEMPRPIACRLFMLLSAIAFWVQWQPLVSGFSAALGTGDWQVLLALGLVTPNTTFVQHWQLDALSVLNGQWLSIFSSIFVHSGLLSLLVCLDAVLHVGAAVEVVYGHGMLLVTLAMCALGMGLAQILLMEAPFAVGAPGVAVGLYASLLAHSLRDPGWERLNPRGLAYVAFSVLLGLYQPLVGIWGIFGAAAGGFVAGTCGYQMLDAINVMVAIPVWLLRALLWLPKLLFVGFAYLAVLVWKTVLTLLSAIRSV